MRYDELVQEWLRRSRSAELRLLEEQCAEAIWLQSDGYLDRLVIVDFAPWLMQPGRWVASQWWPEP